MKYLTRKRWNIAFYTGLRTHKIISKFTGKEALASWVNNDYRIIWNFKKENHILLLDFGTHNEVYL
jgi:mRNA-degrading endonuclease YafQ of YafQ-DinJ toxin-antitoxin module